MEISNPRPWSARRPQSLVRSVLIVVVVVALVLTALRYISDGVGGLVPYLMVVVGPILCGYYIWYWNFYRFDEAPTDGP